MSTDWIPKQPSSSSAIKDVTGFDHVASLTHHAVKDFTRQLHEAPVPTMFKQMLPDANLLSNDPPFSMVYSADPGNGVVSKIVNPGMTTAAEPAEMFVKREEEMQSRTLSETMVNFNRLDHTTPGLQRFSGQPLAALVSNTYFIESCLYPPIYWCPCPPGEPQKPCKAKFLDKRRTKGKLHCDQQIEKPDIPVTQSVPIYWVSLGKNWRGANKGSVTDRLNEAQEWFRKYCIDLDLREFKFSSSKSTRKKVIASLDRRRKADHWAPYTREVIATYIKMWRKWRRTGIYIFFVDEYENFKNHRVISKASATMGTFPVILISSKDMKASHIVTHELIHALGRPWYAEEAGRSFDDLADLAPLNLPKGLPRHKKPWNTSRNLTWEHGDCTDDMGNWLGGGNPSAYFLDASAYKEFALSKSIFLKK